MSEEANAYIARINARIAEDKAIAENPPAVMTTVQPLATPAAQSRAAPAATAEAPAEASRNQFDTGVLQGAT